MMRKPEKTSLRKVIMPEHNAVKKEDMQSCGDYVVDGGALLHRVRWSKDMKFSVIAKVYINYVTKNYHPNATIVFDGYNEGARAFSQIFSATK